MKQKFKVITTTSNYSFKINRDFYNSNPNDKYVEDRSINKNQIRNNVSCNSN